MTYEQMKKESEYYKDQMTNRERMIAYAKGFEVDRNPYTLLSSDTLAATYGFTMRQYRQSDDVKIALAKNLQADFGINGVGIDLGVKKLGEALGSELIYPENGEDYLSKPLIEDYSVLDAMEVVNPLKNAVLTEMMRQIQMYKKVFGERFSVSTTVGGPLTTAASLRKTDYILRDMAKNKDKLHKLIEYSVKCTLAWISTVYNEFGIDRIGVLDPVSSMSLISKKQFLEFSKPHMQVFFDGIVNITKKTPVLHICGKTKPIWQDLADIGFNSFSLDDCEDLEEAKNAVGKSFELSGNVPAVDVIRYGTIDDVIESVRECLKKGSDNEMGYKVAIGCQIPIGTPKENLEAFVFAAKKYGRGARKGCLCKGLSD